MALAAAGHALSAKGNGPAKERNQATQVPMTPRVHIYTVCWNEERFLPYFLRHYATFAERITVLDNMSDDRSAEIVRSFPGAVLQTFDTGGTFRDDIHRDIKNNAWKQSRSQADWVICVDADELLWHPRLADYLLACKKRSITIMVPTGYEMLAEGFPTTSGQVYDEVKHGALNAEYSKPCIFNPDAIAEINYIPGAHKAQPIGLVIAETQSELRLLHFRFLGTDYTLERFAAKRARLSEENKRWGWAMQYEMPPDKILAYMNRFQPRRVQVVP